MKKFFGKSFLYSFAIALIALCNTGCDSADGDWDSMEWQKVVTEKVKVNGVSCYHIPIEGGTYQFNCKNYSSFWISHVRSFGSPSWNDRGDYIYPETNGNVVDHQSITFDGVAVSIKGNKMNVTFDENPGLAKYIEVTVTAGDIFDTFRFVQDSEMYYTE